MNRLDLPNFISWNRCSAFWVGFGLSLAISLWHGPLNAQDDLKQAETSTVAASGDLAAEDDGEEEPGAQTAEALKQVVFHFRDGSVISGKLQAEQITVETAFGTLTIPVRKVLRIVPGLVSNTEFEAELKGLLLALGKAEVEADRAQKKLIGYGSGLLGVLPTLAQSLESDTTGDLAQRRKRYKELRSELESLAQDNFEQQAIQLTQLDQVQTATFTIVGRIVEPSFEIESKYGMLVAKLADLKMAGRGTDSAKEPIQKRIKVDGMAFFQTQPQTTSIRVKKGDRISITAGGLVEWTNWSTSSTADGLNNRGNWMNIPSGKLTARIGEGTQHLIAVGTKSDFIAPASGKLYLGVAMKDSYANNNGYRWNGGYNVRIAVKPR